MAAHVRIPISRCTNHPDKDYDYHVASIGISRLLSRKQYEDVVDTFPESPICSLSVTAVVYWTSALAFGLALYFVMTGAVELGSYMLICALLCVVLVTMWDLCRKKSLMVQACARLTQRYPGLVFTIEPYIVGSVSGRTKQHCLRIQAAVDGLAAPLMREP